MQALRDQGLSDRAIARAFGVSAERVAQILGRKMASHVEAARLKREHSGA